MFRDIEKIVDNGSLVYIKKFIDLNDFLLGVRTTEGINPIFTTLSSIKSSEKFSKTASYEEAWNLCRFTMDTGFKGFYQKFQRLNYEIDYLEKKVNSFSVIGYTPDVPRYLLGIPTSMHSYKKEKKEQTVNIYMNIGYSHYQSHQQIENRGIIVLSLITYLEKQGYKVNLFTYDFAKIESTGKKEKMLIIIPIKTKFESINVKKLYFPLVHPSFLRRLIFRAEEKMPVKQEDWNYGYGIPIEYNEAVSFLKKYIEDFEVEKTIYISTPEEMGINGQNLEDDYENFIKEINLKHDNKNAKRRFK